jgi:hypothetical protein
MILLVVGFQKGVLLVLLVCDALFAELSENASIYKPHPSTHPRTAQQLKMQLRNFYEDSFLNGHRTGDGEGEDGTSGQEWAGVGRGQPTTVLRAAGST